jgi:hypothetical protein
LTDTGSALRATSDTLLADIESLEALEQKKRNLEPGDPRLLELAEAVEHIAGRLLGGSVRQRKLTETATELAVQGSELAPDKSIAETPRAIHLILADWRAAERRVRAAQPGSLEATTAARDVERFRDEYRAAHDAALRRS